MGSYQANELGLYDMTGNVWEWCWDWYDSYGSLPVDNPTGLVSGGNRVLRGGSWNNRASFARVANRTNNDPGNRNNNVGFRLVRPSSLIRIVR